MGMWKKVSSVYNVTGYKVNCLSSSFKVIVLFSVVRLKV